MTEMIKTAWLSDWKSCNGQGTGNIGACSMTATTIVALFRHLFIYTSSLSSFSSLLIPTLQP